MLEEDQNPGSTETAETPIETSQEVSSAPEAPTAEASTETSDTPAVNAPPLDNTIGAALDAFKQELAPKSQNIPGRPNVPATPPPVKQPRDYSGLSPEEVALFKQMNNAAFNTLKPQYLEAKKLREEHEALKQRYEAASKTTFFEQEGAYRLTPEYQQLSSNLQTLDAEASHWEDQLARIAAGEEWIPIELDAQGRPVLGAPRPASHQAHAMVVNALTKANILKTEFSGKLNNLQQNFTSQHKNFVSGLSNVEKSIFQGADKKSLDAAMASKLPLFPEHLHNNPLVQMLAKAAAVIEGMGILLNQQKSAATTQTLKHRTAANAGPRHADLAPGAAKGEKVGAVWDEFAKARSLGQA